MPATQRWAAPSVSLDMAGMSITAEEVTRKRSLFVYLVKAPVHPQSSVFGGIVR